MKGEYKNVIGKTVTVTVDRAMGERHPEFKDTIYPINYGYVQGVPAPDGDWQDAYILGVDVPVKTFTGVIIAVIHRNNDAEEKWIAAPEGKTFTKEQIRQATYFQERYFDSVIITSES